ncbi:hypothetical protein TIFTF001_028418 [Ficus carica]|uniref:Uncharacterized protein n=1 Tax=Ficus carica TaxID=3494 RepID=A0AA88DPY7_FICCA|nr:hypothetical protein TIFTF001_028418 [Ficus carica]
MLLTGILLLDLSCLSVPGLTIFLLLTLLLSTTFDFGKHIFDEITEIKNPNDPMEPIPSVLKVSKKLLSGRHVNDLGLPEQQEDVQPDAAVHGEQTSVDLDVSTSADTSVSQAKKLKMLLFMSGEVQFLKQQRVHLKQRQRELESIITAYEAEDEDKQHEGRDLRAPRGSDFQASRVIFSGDEREFCHHGFLLRRQFPLQRSPPIRAEVRELAIRELPSHIPSASSGSRPVSTVADRVALRHISVASLTSPTRC